MSRKPDCKVAKLKSKFPGFEQPAHGASLLGWAKSIKYNFRAEQRVSSNLIGRAVPYMALYKPLQAVYITFLRPGY